jgi:hypothetical protein
LYGAMLPSTSVALWRSLPWVLRIDQWPSVYCSRRLVHMNGRCLARKDVEGDMS